MSGRRGRGGQALPQMTILCLATLFLSPLIARDSSPEDIMAMPGTTVIIHASPRENFFLCQNVLRSTHSTLHTGTWITWICPHWR